MSSLLLELVLRVIATLVWPVRFSNCIYDGQQRLSIASYWTARWKCVFVWFIFSKEISILKKKKQASAPSEKSIIFARLCYVNACTLESSSCYAPFCSESATSSRSDLNSLTLLAKTFESFNGLAICILIKLCQATLRIFRWFDISFLKVCCAAKLNKGIIIQIATSALLTRIRSWKKECFFSLNQMGIWKNVFRVGS